MNAHEQVVDRTQFIGSSDMAAILGLSPWATPLDLFLQKRREAAPADADPEKAKLFRRGKRMEPVIVNMLEEERGLVIVARNQRYTDKEYDFLRCEIDAEAMVDGMRVNVECKSAHPFTAFKYGDADTDQTPIEYTVQAMFSLMITVRQRCLFGVLFGTDNLVMYQLERDEETITAMRQKAVAFWRDHILPGIQPAPINLPDVEKMLRRTPPKKIVATPEIEDLVVALENLRADERIAQEGIQEKKFELGKAVLGATAVKREVGPRGGLGDVEPTADAPREKHLIVVGGEPRLQIGLQSRTGIDSEKVRKEYPEAAAACTTVSDFIKFAKPPKPKSTKRYKRAA